MLKKGVYHVRLNPLLKEGTPMGPCNLIHKKGMSTCVLCPEYGHIQSAEQAKAGHPSGLSLLQENDLPKNCERIVLQRIFGIIECPEGDPMAREKRIPLVLRGVWGIPKLK